MTKPVQCDLFGGKFTLPAEITVGPFGVHGDWLTEILNVTHQELYAWHGNELGAPRDYRSASHGYFYTAEGVRRILKLLRYSDLVQVIEQAPGPTKNKIR